MSRTVAVGVVLAIAAAAAGLGSPARAGESACEPVVQAMQALEKAPGYHTAGKTTFRDGRVSESEGIVLDEATYVRKAIGNGQWLKVPRVGNGQETLASVLERFPPHACVVEGTEEVGGRTTRVYGFRQGISVPAQPAAAQHDAAEAAESVNRVWIDEADGRPRKVESEFAGLRRSMTIDYEAIKPPVS